MIIKFFFYRNNEFDEAEPKPIYQHPLQVITWNTTPVRTTYWARKRGEQLLVLVSIYYIVWVAEFHFVTKVCNYVFVVTCVISSETEAQSSQFANAKKPEFGRKKRKIKWRACLHLLLLHAPPPPRSGNTSPNNQVSQFTLFNFTHAHARLYANYSQFFPPKLEAATNNGASHVDDKKPNFTDGLE